jgi:hypothetical protein
MIASGGGGHPGTPTSTRFNFGTPPPEAKLVLKIPPERAHAPTAKTRFGVGMAAKAFWMESSI